MLAGDGDGLRGIGSRSLARQHGVTASGRAGRALDLHRAELDGVSRRLRRRLDLDAVAHEAERQAGSREHLAERLGRASSPLTAVLVLSSVTAPSAVTCNPA